MQNALPRVDVIEREAARLGASYTEFIRWPWWRRKTLRHTHTPVRSGQIVYNKGVHKSAFMSILQGNAMIDFAAIYNTFDEDESLPASDTVRYVDLSPVRGDSIVDLLAKLVRYAGDAPSHHLLRGHTKCGKTTELNRTARKLEDAGYATVMFDVAEVATRTFEYTAVLMIMAGQIIEQLAKRPKPIKIKGENERELTQFLLNRQIVRGAEYSGDLTGKVEGESSSLLAGLLGKLGLGLEMRGGFQRSREITVQIEADKRGFLRRVQEIVRDADHQVRQAGLKGLVIICDGCDKLEINAADENGRSRDLQCEMFEDHGPDLRDIPCHVIYTVPISIQANLSNDWGEIQFVPAVPVNKLPGVLDEFPARGRRLLTEVVSRRLGTQNVQIEQLFESVELLDRLISFSGGHISDMLLMVRSAILDADEPGQAQIGEKNVNRAILKRAHDFTFLIETRHLDVLREIDEFKTRPGNSDLYRDVMFKRLALEYICEEKVRVDLHPLVAASEADRRYRDPRAE